MKVTIEFPQGTKPETAQAAADAITAMAAKLNRKQWRILERAMKASSMFLSVAFGKIESALNDNNI